MPPDAETLAAYEEHAGLYSERFGHAAAESSRELEAFAGRVTAGGRVLDLGCGPGWAARWFADRGFGVHAVDASPAFAGIARRDYGIEVELADFADLRAEAAYDGVWASFSLLHLPRAEMPAMLARLARAARPSAPLYLGLKEGDGEGRDRLGRFYTYWRAAGLEPLLAAAGFTLRETARSESSGLSGEVSTGLHLIATRDA